MLLFVKSRAATTAARFRNTQQWAYSANGSSLKAEEWSSSPHLRGRRRIRTMDALFVMNATQTHTDTHRHTDTDTDTQTHTQTHTHARERRDTPSHR